MKWTFLPEYPQRELGLEHQVELAKLEGLRAIAEELHRWNHYLQGQIEARGEGPPGVGPKPASYPELDQALQELDRLLPLLPVVPHGEELRHLVARARAARGADFT